MSLLVQFLRAFIILSSLKEPQAAFFIFWLRNTLKSSARKSTQPDPRELWASTPWTSLPWTGRRWTKRSSPGHTRAAAMCMATTAGPPEKQRPIRGNVPCRYHCVLHASIATLSLKSTWLNLNTCCGGGNCWIWPKIFSTAIEMTRWFLSLYQLWCITSIDCITFIGYITFIAFCMLWLFERKWPAGGVVLLE